MYLAWLFQRDLPMCLMSIGRLARTTFKMALSESERHRPLLTWRLLALCTKQKKDPRAADGQTPKCECFSALCIHCICFCTSGQNKSHGLPDSRGRKIYSTSKGTGRICGATYHSLCSSHNYSYSSHMQNMLSHVPGPPKLDSSNLGLFL